MRDGRSTPAVDERPGEQLAPWTVSTAREALRRAQKPPHGTPAYSRFVNRPLGRQFAALATVAGLSPNQVSMLSGLCSLAAILVLALVDPAWWTGLLIGALLIAGYALDSADGQVARLTGRGSKFGEWLDHMIDCVKITTLHVAVVVYLFRFTDFHAGWILVPLGYLVVSVVFFFGMMLTDQLRRSAGADPMAKTASLSVVRALAILPTDFGALCVVFLTAGIPAVFLGLYSAMALLNVGILALVVVKWGRELKAIGAVR